MSSMADVSIGMVPYYNPLGMYRSPQNPDSGVSAAMSQQQLSPHSQQQQQAEVRHAVMQQQVVAAAAAAASADTSPGQQYWYGYSHGHLGHAAHHHHYQSAAPQQYFDHASDVLGWPHHPHYSHHLPYQHQQSVYQQHQLHHQQQQQQQQLQLSGAMSDWSGDDSSPNMHQQHVGATGAGETSPAVTGSGSDTSNPGTPITSSDALNSSNNCNKNSAASIRCASNSSAHSNMANSINSPSSVDTSIASCSMSSSSMTNSIVNNNMGNNAMGNNMIANNVNAGSSMASTSMASPGSSSMANLSIASTSSAGGSSPPMRQTPTRSPFEWMNKPSYQSQPNPACTEAPMSTDAVGELDELCTLDTLGKTRTKDKYRVVYTDHQRLELEKEFHFSRYITIRRKAELAASLALSERQVKIWFQNRRAKERKLSKKREEMKDDGKPSDMGTTSGMANLSLGGMGGMLGGLMQNGTSSPLSLAPQSHGLAALGHPSAGLQILPHQHQALPHPVLGL